jgi:hypothetical protein
MTLSTGFTGFVARTRLAVSRSSAISIQTPHDYFDY